MRRIAVFISGSGTNLQALIDAIQAGTLDAEIGLVVSNRKAAYGLERAAAAGIPTLYFPLKPFTDRGELRAAYDAALAEAVQPYAPDLIVLAGWMHVLSSAFLDQFPDRVINLHPALPGTCAGIDAIERTFAAIQRGDLEHGGCMVHYVVPKVDAGPVIDQTVVSVVPADTLEAFESRLHDAEHKLIVRATQKALTKLEVLEPVG